MTDIPKFTVTAEE